jgi:proteasome lid subunit RPN8/RPN11
MLVLPSPLWDRMVANCLDCLPLEACGLLSGIQREVQGGALGQPSREGEVRELYPAVNAARSARLYSVEPLDLLRADRAAESSGLELIGVWHSHTHTPAYPSPTDVRQAPDPQWHYVLVSLSDLEPVVRSYRIADGSVEEEPVVVPV